MKGVDCLNCTEKSANDACDDGHGRTDVDHNRSEKLYDRNSNSFCEIVYDSKNVHCTNTYLWIELVFRKNCPKGSGKATQKQA